jgi:coenzyme F420-0:L-glutamate ligase/coenzyme F420-1:gamma-L-glutamate ligase
VGGTDVSLIGVYGMPMVRPGDDIADLVADALAAAGKSLEPLDVIVVASTIVSKAEGRYFDLGDVVPSVRAEELAAITKKDPRLVEVVLRESVAVSRTAPNVLIVRHRLGFVSANAGIDFSNVGETEEIGLLLPADPDRSATELRERLEQRCSVKPLAVVISDTHGRAFRKGNVGIAIGISGVPALVDETGNTDLFGRVLVATVVPLADQLASAAGLVSGETSEGLPVVIVRGVTFDASRSSATELMWSPAEDLYA